MATLDVTEERRRAIDRVNRAYADEDYDRYERLIERYCHRFGFDGDYGLFEDACTDARLFGHGIGYIFPLMEVEPTICIELKDEG